MSSIREILIVDDDDVVARTLHRALARWYVVETSGSALEALVRIERGERFGVILSDVMMPEMNGLDLHADLLSWAPDQAAAMIFMTGGVSELEHARLTTISNPVLTKPVSLADLRTVIDVRLADRRS